MRAPIRQAGSQTSKAIEAYQDTLSDLISQHTPNTAAALVIGAAVGGVPFRLSKTFDRILGADYCAQFVNTCIALQSGSRSLFVAHYWLVFVLAPGGPLDVLACVSCLQVQSLFRSRRRSPPSLKEAIPPELSSSRFVLLPTACRSTWPTSDSFVAVFVRQLTWLPVEIGYYPVVMFHEFFDRAINPKGSHSGFSSSLNSYCDL